MRAQDGTGWTTASPNDALTHLRLSVLTGSFRIVAVVGAGASYESGVPLGDTVCDTMAKLVPDHWLAFKKSRAAPTLESFLDFLRPKIAGNSQDVIAHILAEAGIPKAEEITVIPTVLHMLVAKLVASGCASVVISLNFDELLERCLIAEAGLPAPSNKEHASGNAPWISCADSSEFRAARRLCQRATSNPDSPCVVLKPHGTISRPETLVAAARDVAQYDQSLRSLLSGLLRDGNVSFLFLGCSLRDSDFHSLCEEVGPVAASMAVLDTKPLDDWLEGARESLPSKMHPFDLPDFEESRITYVRCDPEGPRSSGSAIGTETQSFRLSAQVGKSPGNMLLAQMVSANSSTGHLSHRNAPPVTDIEIHSWVRTRLVGKRPAIESFLATEILIGAALDNGLFTRERLFASRGHLEIAERNGFRCLLDELLSRFTDCGMLVQDKHGRYALCKVGSMNFRRHVRRLLGPFHARHREATGKDSMAELYRLLKKIGETKASSSYWTTRTPKELLSTEQSTALVLETTDELSVVSEYGTWMRSPRFRDRFLKTIERQPDPTYKVQVLIASPPPNESQGYLEWIVSALWLWKLRGVELFVLDAEQHRHHMTLGQQVAIDFKRKGTDHRLRDNRVTFSALDRDRLRRTFRSMRNKAESFDRWQLRAGLDMQFPSFSLHYLCHDPLSQVTIRHDPGADRSVEVRKRSEARQRWDNENDRRVAKGKPKLVAKRLYRPVRASRAGNRIVVAAGLTSYFDNFYLQRRVSKWNDDLIIGAGLSVIPETADGLVMLGRRSSVVAAGAGKFHVVGGHAHPSRGFRHSSDSLCDAVYEELIEELHVPKTEVARLTFLGLAIDLAKGKPEFIVRAKLKPRAEEISSSWCSSKAGQRVRYGGQEEFSRITTLQTLLGYRSAAQCASSVPFPLPDLWRVMERLVPAARAALVCHWIQSPHIQVDELAEYVL